jgi:hypothetical protein
MALAGNQHTGGEEELNPCTARRKTAPATAVTANFGNLVSRSATHGHKCGEKCRYLGCNRSMTSSGMKAPRSPPTSQKTNPSRVFGPARVVTQGKVALKISRTSRETLQVPSGLRRAEPWSSRHQERLRLRCSQRMRRLYEDGHSSSAR